MRAAVLAIALFPCLQDPEQLVQSALKKAEQKDLDGALADCSRAVELDPSSLQAWATRGSLRWRKGDARGAIADLTQAIERGLRSDSVYALRALCRLGFNEFPEAEADSTLALQLNPRTPGARAVRGIARYRLGEFRTAVSDLSLGMLDTPADVSLLMSRAGAYYGLGSWENALRDFRALAELDPARLPAVLPWIWAARARSGDRNGADEELLKALLTIPEVRKAGWNHGLVRFLLGHLKEDELLKGTEEFGDDRDAYLCDARFFIATRELAAAKDTAALESLQACVATRRKHQAAWLGARAELDARHVRNTERVLAPLEERFRALRRCHAEFRFKTLSAAGEDLENEESATFSVDLDRAAGRTLVSFADTAPQGLAGARLYFDGMTAYAWEKDGVPMKKDMTPLFNEIDRFEATALAELDRIVPPSEPVKSSPREPTMILVLEGRPSREVEGTFRFAIGRGSHPCSWTRDSIDRPDTSVTERKDEVTLEIPSRRKSIVIEKATGFVLKMEARDYDGKRRVLIRTAFSTEAPFPKLKLDNSRPAPPDAGFFQTWTDNHVQALSLRVYEAVARWERAREAGKTGEIRALFRRWLVDYMNLVHQHFAKQAAGRYVQWLLNQGVKMDDLRDKSDEHLRNFKTWAAQGELRKALEDHLAELGRKVAVDLIEDPIDSRLHRTLFSLETQVFDFERIEQDRRKDDDAHLEKAFREELEAARRL